MKKKNKKNYKKIEKTELKKVKGGADKAGYRFPVEGAMPSVLGARLRSQGNR